MFWSFLFVTRETEAEMTNAFDLSALPTDIFGLMVKNKALVGLSSTPPDRPSKPEVAMLAVG